MFLKEVISFFILGLFSCANLQNSVVQIIGDDNVKIIDNDVNQKRYFQEVFKEITFETLTYGKNTTQGGNKMELKLDLYQPKGDQLTKRPLFIYVHGGGFTRGDRAAIKPIGFLQTLAKSGYVVASISYRLLDVPADMKGFSIGILNAVEDARAAIRFFRKDAGLANNYKIDTDQIFLGGYSAGAISALHTAYLNTTEKIETYLPFLTSYVRDHGGIEGNSGNSGYSSSVKGVFNIAGAMLSVDLLDKNTSILYSLHGKADQVVPFDKKINNLEGSKFIHDKAEKLGLMHNLNAVPNTGHDVLVSCDECREDMQQFLAANTK